MLAAPAAVGWLLCVCCSGSSRLVLANLDHLPQECKPGHNAVAAAVFECFASWRVSVQNCRLTVVPGRAASRAGLDCKVMHAQGSLQGEYRAWVGSPPSRSTTTSGTLLLRLRLLSNSGACDNTHSSTCEKTCKARLSCPKGPPRTQCEWPDISVRTAAAAAAAAVPACT